MKKMRKFFALALIICGLFITQALFAQQDQKQDVEQKQGMTQNQEVEKKQEGQPQKIEKPVIEQQARVSNLIGRKVISEKGEDLGTVDDLVLSQDKCLDYLILAHGGVAGIGDRLTPIPWKAVKTGSKADTVIVDVDKEELVKAPSFERKKWPDFSDSEWYGKIKDFFGKK